MYIFINNITKDTYIGSSVNLTRRIAVHIFHAGSNKETNIVFYRAMRKYGLENFSLAIIEFCTPDLASCLELEQKWIDYYQPKYNILKEARSSIGFRHSKETINKLKDMFSKENHPK